MLGTMMKKELLISDLIAHAGKYHADTEIVSRETDGTLNTTNWSEVDATARKLASALGGLGLRMGDRVATLAWNNHRHLKIWFAVSGGGMVCHTLNPRLAPQELSYILEHSESQLVLVDAEVGLDRVEDLICKGKVVPVGICPSGIEPLRSNEDGRVCSKWCKAVETAVHNGVH